MTYNYTYTIHAFVQSMQSGNLCIRPTPESAECDTCLSVAQRAPSHCGAHRQQERVMLFRGPAHPTVFNHTLRSVSRNSDPTR